MKGILYKNCNLADVHCHAVDADMYESYRERACWDVVKAPPQGTVLNIVRAANSDRYRSHASLCALSHASTLTSLTSLSWRPSPSRLLQYAGNPIIVESRMLIIYCSMPLHSVVYFGLRSLQCNLCY